MHFFSLNLGHLSESRDWAWLTVIWWWNLHPSDVYGPHFPLSRLWQVYLKFKVGPCISGSGLQKLVLSQMYAYNVNFWSTGLGRETNWKQLKSIPAAAKGPSEFRRSSRRWSNEFLPAAEVDWIALRQSLQTQPDSQSYCHHTRLWLPFYHPPRWLHLGTQRSPLLTRSHKGRRTWERINAVGIHLARAAWTM